MRIAASSKPDSLVMGMHQGNAVLLAVLSCAGCSKCANGVFTDVALHWDRSFIAGEAANSQEQG